jgi:hypothetical protein
MEPVIFWTTLSAVLGSATTHRAPKIWMTMMKENVSKFSKMKESKAWFTIKLNDRTHTVSRIVQADESVIFIAEIDDRKIQLYRGENDCWLGDAEQELIDSIGRAIEEA